MEASTIRIRKKTEIAPAEDSMAARVVIDGVEHTARDGEPLIDLINRAGVKLAQVCYHPQLGPLATTVTHGHLPGPR